MKHVIKFVIKEKFVNVRAIADHICIALMRYNVNKPTYSAIIVKNAWKNMLDSNVPPTCYIDDNTRVWYTIKIYKLVGNRSSILSPNHNEYFNKCILSDEIINSMIAIQDEGDG